jgi:FHA domain/Domain of unknown function (DUF1707)
MRTAVPTVQAVYALVPRAGPSVHVPGAAEVAAPRLVCHDRSLSSVPALREHVRPSRADRERVAGALRRACEEERLSLDTFSLRLDLVYAARTRAELDRLTTDLREPSVLRAAVVAAVAWVSRWSDDVAKAWRLGRAQPLVLQPLDCVVIGRGSGADFVVADQTVSARHAILHHTDGIWILRDAGSSNGTFLNGYRVRGPVEVRAGDELTVGSSQFVLARREIDPAGVSGRAGRVS